MRPSTLYLVSSSTTDLQCTRIFCERVLSQLPNTREAWREREKHSGAVFTFESSCEAQFDYYFIFVIAQLGGKRVYINFTYPTLILTSLTCCDSKIAALNANHIIQRSPNIHLSYSSVFYHISPDSSLFAEQTLNGVGTASDDLALKREEEKQQLKDEKKKFDNLPADGGDKTVVRFFCGAIDGTITQKLNCALLTTVVRRRNFPFRKQAMPFSQHLENFFSTKLNFSLLN